MAKAKQKERSVPAPAPPISQKPVESAWTKPVAFFKKYDWLAFGITYVIAGAEGGHLHFLAKNGEFFDYIAALRIDDHYFFIVRDMKGETRDEFTVGR